MVKAFKNEKEVEINLIAPLFRDSLGYDESQLQWGKSVRITFGREVKDKEADLVVFHKKRPVITVEAKAPTETVQSGFSQVDSYAFALQTPYSIVTNGKHFVLRGYYSFNSRINVIDESVSELRRDHWGKLASLISFKNIISSIQPANVISQPNEEKIKDYRRFFRKLHSEIRDRDKLDPGAAFDELSKLLFLKAAEDEWQTKTKSRPVLTADKIAEWESIGKGSQLVNEWFRSAVIELFPSVFESDARINLTTGTLKAVLEMMKPFHVRNGDVDVKGRAFEEFLPSQLRGKGLGQYFTPRPIVNFMAEIAGISLRDTVVDFSCGSGGFLIKAFEIMQNRLVQLPNSIITRLGSSRSEILEGIKTQQLHGIDAEPRAARTAKMNMLMWGDGKRVVRGNGLDTTDFSGQPYDPPEYDKSILGSGCTVILANPPFGSVERDAAILNRYILGSKLKSKATEKTEILFLEKGMKLLQPEGRMLIVIPQGLLSGTKYAPVRDFLHSHSEIRAIVSLPTHTFVQSGVPTVNACILYVQKFTEEKAALFKKKSAALDAKGVRDMLRTDPEFDYHIFMGTSEFVGYEPSGRMIADHDEKTDLDLLIEDFDHLSVISHPDIDVFDFAAQHYGEKGYRRKEQVVRGTQRGLKTSFSVRLSDTSDRLDPPYYLFRFQADGLIKSLVPLGESVTKSGTMFTPSTDDELDADYAILTVSSDGTVTLNDHRSGEELMSDTGKGKRKSGAKPVKSTTTIKRFQKVREGDIVYNPMRVNIGSIGVVSAELDGGLVSPDYTVFRSGVLSPEFLVNLLRSPFYKMYIDVVTTGSIRDRLYLSDLKKIRVPQVTPENQESISEWMRQVDDSATEMLRAIKEERDAVAMRLHGLVGSAAIKKRRKNAPLSGSVSGTSIGIQRFMELAGKWHSEADILSNVTKKAIHPSYQQIIGMGERAVPMILSELQQGRYADWFWALTAITGENPITADIAGNVERMAAAWIKWGQARGYLKGSRQNKKPHSKTSEASDT